MKTKFPLWLKILLWFFLNVLFLCVVFLIVARAQFRFGWDSLIAGPAGEPVRSTARLLVVQLEGTPRTQWNDVLARLGEEHQVKFYLFHFSPGQLEQVAGELIELPQEVRSRILELPGRNQPPGQSADGGMRGQDGQFPPRGGGPGRRGGPGGRGAGPPQSMVHADGRYWVTVTVGPEARIGTPSPPLVPMPAAIVVAANSMTAGGLFFNATPWIYAALAVILISTLFWLPLIRGITHAISRMTAATGQIAEGRFEVRAEVNRADELGALSDAINRMAARLSGLVTGQKRFLGDIAHELCSPLSRIQVSLAILEDSAGEKQKSRLADLREEVELMSSLVNELLSFSRASLGQSNPRLQAALLKPIVEKAISRECGPASGVQVKIEIAEDARGVAEPELLQRAIANVLRNAVRYAGSAGPLAVSAEKSGDWILLHIDDCGPGIPEPSLPMVFDPFYRVDASRTRDTGGVGLGLSIVKTCIESCGGTVSCANRQPSGLRVTLKLRAS